MAIRKSKKCANCGEKLKDSYSFCPNCGMPTGNQQKNYGILGKREIKGQTPMQPEIFSGIGSGIFNKMLGSAMKMLEKEMQKEMSQSPLNNSRVKVMINGKEINPQNKDEKGSKKFLPIEFSKENLNKWTKLEKTEPISNLKRVDDKIEYEIEVPGVESIKDVSIVKLENSLEVKALAKKTAYVKTVPINLPLKKYSLLKGKLILELDASL